MYALDTIAPVQLLEPRRARSDVTEKRFQQFRPERADDSSVRTDQCCVSGTVEFDIFISYTHEDSATAKRLAEELSSHGWSVFWDRVLLPGATWRTQIQSALVSARVVIVMWSDKSVNSRWVEVVHHPPPRFRADRGELGGIIRRHRCSGPHRRWGGGHQSSSG